MCIRDSPTCCGRCTCRSRWASLKPYVGVRGRSSHSRPPGLRWGLYLLYSIVARPLVAEVVGRHIVYDSPHFHLVPVMVLYLAATCVSCFVSSHGFVRLFGVLSLLSFIAAYIVHVGALVSIWCFFAAILSLLIYLHLRFRDRGGFPAPIPIPPIVPVAVTSRPT